MRATTASPWLRAPLVVLVVLAVQTTILTDLRPFGALADVMLLLAITAGIISGPRDGALYGFGAGLAYDLLLRTPFGLSALTYALVGYGAGYLQNLVAAARWWSTMLIVAAASALGVIAYALIGTVFGLKDAVTTHLVTVIAVVSVANGLLALPVLWVQRWALLARDPA